MERAESNTLLSEFITKIINLRYCRTKFGHFRMLVRILDDQSRNEARYERCGCGCIPQPLPLLSEGGLCSETVYRLIPLFFILIHFH